MILNSIIALIFYNLGYFVITPKPYSFGGQYLTLIYGLKFSNQKNKKSLIVVSFINLHEKNFLNIYNIDLLKRIFFKYNFFDKMLCILLSIILNLNLIILLFLRKLRVWKYFSKVINYLFSDYIGYANRYDEIYLNRVNGDFFLKKINFKLDKNVILQNINLSYLYSNFPKTPRLITFCIKDNNYAKLKEISSIMTSDVNKCKKSINFLVNLGFNINKVGDPTMIKFNYNHKSYNDYSCNPKHQIYLNQCFANCDFYFGSGASHGVIAELFDKERVIINYVDHIELSHSSSLKNFFLFKKISLNNKNSFLKLEDLFKKNLMSYKNLSEAFKKNQISVAENTAEEILEFLIEFYEHKYKKRPISQNLNKKYFELRREYLEKNYNSLNIDFLNNIKCTVSSKYLSEHL